MIGALAKLNGAGMLLANSDEFRCFCAETVLSIRSLRRLSQLRETLKTPITFVTPRWRTLVSV